MEPHSVVDAVIQVFLASFANSTNSQLAGVMNKNGLELILHNFSYASSAAAICCPKSPS
jgi:hypothetical protein